MGCFKRRTPDDQFSDVYTASEQDKNMKKEKNTVYIRVPLSELFGSGSTSRTFDGKDIVSAYILIDGLPSKKEIRGKKSYVMSYDKETKNAEWVYEILNKSMFPVKDPEKESEKSDRSYFHLSSAYDTTKWERMLDKTCLSVVRGAPTNKSRTDKASDKKKEYHKGHLSAAANHQWCQEAGLLTYVFSNLTPQNAKLNLRQWQSIEKRLRKDSLGDEIRNIHVYTGPLYLTGKKKPVVEPKIVKDSTLKGKALPTHFFKVVIRELNDGKVKEPECFIIANEKLPYTYVPTASIEEIERLSGLTFIERGPVNVVKDSLRKVRWVGEDDNGEICHVDIEVRISSLQILRFRF